MSIEIHSVRRKRPLSEVSRIHTTRTIKRCLEFYSRILPATHQSKRKGKGEEGHRFPERDGLQFVSITRSRSHHTMPGGRELKKSIRINTPPHEPMPASNERIWAHLLPRDLFSEIHTFAVSYSLT